MKNFKNISGKRFCRLVAIKPTSIKNGYNYWLFKCDCGCEKEIRLDSVVYGKTKSCGCLQKEIVSKKQGLSSSRIYRTLAGIKQRCYNKNCSAYKNYGGRGIKICNEWKNDFLSFYNWANQNGYMDNLTIDRIDVNGNYEPFNCRWITMKEQHRNTRKNKMVAFNGKTMCISEISEKYGIPWSTLDGRIKRGIDIKEAINIGKSKFYGNKIFCETNGKTYNNINEFFRDVGLKRYGHIYEIIKERNKFIFFKGYKIKKI